MGLHGMNVSVLAGWYTFSNFGPLTTTYTPSPQCSATDQMYIGYVNTDVGNLVPQYAVQCTTELAYYSECMPTTTEASTTTPPEFTGTSYEEYDEWESSQIEWEGYGEYYSPGLECPAGWATVGMIGRDAGDKVTSSGILSPSKTTTVTRYTTGSDIYYYEYEDKASVMKSFLEPEQTMAICCPSGMTADNYDACYSIVKTYTPTYGCQVYTGYNYDYGEATTTYLDPTDSVMSTVTYDTPTATHTTVETDTWRFDRDEQTYYSGLMYAPAITLLYHESDLQGATIAAASAASGDGNGNGTETETETPSNAARRLGASGSSWDGIGSVLGVWIVAAALGAAMVRPL
ncbi:hypothetical protein BJY01DRAFT_248843 [Aspergillus pseudoustus]|uniref:Uncharacterized protein n=1 Tax=Aspergillus pseudoustus TaxID=1810923 RepID=A0ABR4JS69_9EURO